VPTGSSNATGVDLLGPTRYHQWTWGLSSSATTTPGETGTRVPLLTADSFTIPLPGPYEASHPPAGNWTAPRGTTQSFEKNTENVSGGFGLLGPPVVAQPQGSATTTAPKPATFDESVLLWTAWTIANFGGKPSAQAVSQEAQKQF